MVACTLDPSQIGSAPDNFPLLYFPPRPPAPPHAVTTRYGMVQDTGTLDDDSTDRWIPVRTVSPRSPLNALLFAASHVFQPLGWRSWNAFGARIYDSTFREAIDALTAKNWTVDGSPTKISLADVGCTQQQPLL